MLNLRASTLTQRSNDAPLTTAQSWGQAVEGDHEEISSLIPELERPEDTGALRSSLQRLAQLLLSHLAAEEAPGGFYEQARQATSPRADELDALALEHADLAAEAGELWAQAADGLPEGLPDRAARFADALREHEARETRLLADLAYEEAGAGD